MSKRRAMTPILPGVGDRWNKGAEGAVQFEFIMMVKGIFILCSGGLTRLPRGSRNRKTNPKPYIRSSMKSGGFCWIKQPDKNIHHTTNIWRTPNLIPLNFVDQYNKKTDRNLKFKLDCDMFKCKRWLTWELHLFGRQSVCPSKSCGLTSSPCVTLADFF